MSPIQTIDNRLLAALPASALQLLTPQLQPSSAQQGTQLFNDGDEVENVYFPTAGMISLVAVMQDGAVVETATVGNESVVGAMAGLGRHISMVRAIIQLPFQGLIISAGDMRAAVLQSDPLRQLIMLSNDLLLAQTQLTAACNALHGIEARFCRWILQTHDRTDGDSFPLTQEFLSQMLGVRRSSVSEVASKMQNAGLLKYSRGQIQVTDRAGLEGASCECYSALRAKSSRIVGH